MRTFAEFTGNQRFEVLSRLGQGGMGAVYQVVDRSRNVRVALKSVGEVSGEGLYRFKREYRALSAIRHPNLVELGELFEMDQRWFFTMELIDGVDFYSHVRGEAAANDNARPLADAAVEALKGRPLAPSAVGFSEARLRRALAGLVSGVAALHAKGLLHRDVKPGNVLVSDEGRVVLIDFGLVTGLDRAKQGTEISMVGTVPYMSPEQAAQDLLGPASDWYSVGVMLYECLTGRLPIDDAPLRLAMRKQLEVPPSPQSLVPGVPADLDALCVALLEIDPRKRPTVQEIHRRLHVDAQDLSARPSTNLSVVSLPDSFVGRASELSRLSRALADTHEGRQRSVSITGPSGIGKSALLLRFQAELEALAPDTLVLFGRCHEPRTVRFGAIAEVMEALSRWLKAQPAELVRTLLPADVGLIAGTFPVLERVPAVSHAPRVARSAEDPQERRRALAAGVRELFRRISERYRTVLILEDMQWSDEDSFHLMRELMRAPDAPPLLLVYSRRFEEGAADEPRRVYPVADEVLLLRPLPAAESGELVRRLGTAASEDAAKRAVVAAQGQPFLLEALAHEHAGEGVAQGVLERLLGSLGKASRALLEVIALAGEPITKRLAAEAAGIAPEDANAELRPLRMLRWVQSAGSQVTDLVTLTHDRVRQTVLAKLGAEQREDLHRALASALEEARAEPDLLAHHYLRAGDHARAEQNLRKAAQRALAALAFDHAAALLAARIELARRPPEETRDLMIAYGDALASAGRGLEAAVVYAEASAQSSGTVAVDLQRRIAEQYLLGGRYDDGMKACASFLAAFGIEFPATPRSALLQLVVLRGRIALRGHGFKARQPEQVAQEELAHIDALWSMAKSLATHDVIRGQLFQSRGLLRALSAGEPSRVSRALSAEYVNVVVRSPERHKQAEELLVRAVELANELSSPYALGLTYYCRGLGEFAGLCRFAEALDSMSQGLSILRSECRDVGWEMTQSVIIGSRCRMYLGDWRALRDVSQECQEAAARGDVYLGLVLRGQVLSFLALVDDRADEAAAGVEEAFRPIERAPSPLNRFLRELAGLKVLQYRGQAEKALAVAATHRKGLVDTLLLSAPVLRLMGTEAALLSVLLAVEQKLDLKVRLREASSIVGKLERDRAGATAPSSQLGRAAIAHAQGQTERALSWLARAEAGFAAHHRDADAAAVRRRRGQLLGGDEGRALRLAAERWFAGQGTRNVAAMCRLLAPGFAGLEEA